MATSLEFTRKTIRWRIFLLILLIVLALGRSNTGGGAPVRIPPARQAPANPNTNSGGGTKSGTGGQVGGNTSGEVGGNGTAGTTNGR